METKWSLYVWDWNRTPYGFSRSIHPFYLLQAYSSRRIVYPSVLDANGNRTFLVVFIWSIVMSIRGPMHASDEWIRPKDIVIFQPAIHGSYSKPYHDS
jgi:hypothetical protein